MLQKHTATGANQGNLLSIGTPFDNQLILGFAERLQKSLLHSVY